MLEEPFIKVRGVWYTYPGDIVALKGIDLDVGLGQLMAIIGENGSGKTTLVKHFNGLLKPTKGVVTVDGVDTREAKIGNLAKKVGYVFQNPDHQFFKETVEEELEFGARNIGLPAEEVEKSVEEALRSLGLEKCREKYPRSLTRGLKRRVTIASVLSMRPKVIILDEPTTGQDYYEAREIMDLAKKIVGDGNTVIIITHDMPLVAEYAEQVVVMGEGKILMNDSEKAVFSRPDILATTSLFPPQITQLAQALGEFGVPKDILTITEFYDFITSRRRD